MPAVTVIGLGNVLMQDDAFGPQVIQEFLAAYEVDAQVAVHDLGTPGLDLAPYLEDTAALVVVDTVSAAAEPGALRRYRRDDLLHQPLLPRLNPHQPGVKETLLLLELVGRGPREVLLLGVVPQSVDTGIGLSEPLRAAVPVVLREVVAELERLGHPPRPRPDAAPPHLWWAPPGPAG